MSKAEGEFAAAADGIGRNRQKSSIVEGQKWISHTSADVPFRASFATHSRISSHTPGRPMRERKTRTSVTGGSSFGGTRCE
jgi:hypothetical protein